MVVWFHCLLVMVSAAYSEELKTSTAEGSESSTSSFSVVENAVYTAEFDGSDLVRGEFAWTMIHRGEENSLLDLSDSNFAFTDLSQEVGEVVWGTTHDHQRIVLAENSVNEIKGAWTKHGKKFPGTTIFECEFPPALSTTLVLSTPANIAVKSSVGLVSAEEIPDRPQFRRWMIELGRHQSASISLSVSTIRTETQLPKVEIEAVNVARQDGIFVQSDLSLEGLNTSDVAELDLLVPSSFAVQSITSNGVAIPFQRERANSRRVVLQLPDVLPRTRVNLRVQGFQPVRWVRPHVLPTLRIGGTMESKIHVSVRVESPLEVHDMKPAGFFQVGLSKESRGEIWQFEAFAENPQITVDLGQPRNSLSAQVFTLNDLDTPLPWTASRVTLDVKSGRLFNVNLSIPKQWTIVDLHAVNFESEIASWSMNQGELEISFKDPISSDSQKKIEVLARLDQPTYQVDQKLPVLLVRDVSSLSIQSSWILPAAYDIEFAAGSRWNRPTVPIDLSQFAHLPEFNNQPSSSQTRRSFFNTNVAQDAIPTYRIIPKSDLDDPKLEADEVVLPTFPGREEQSESNSIPSGTFRLLTQAESLDDSIEPRLVHHATIELFGQVDPNRLKLALSESCLLSSVTVNQRSVTVFREGDAILFPKDQAQATEITLIYITNAQHQTFQEFCKIPLPQSLVDISRFDWTLELPPERSLRSLSIPGGTLDTEPVKYPFGPLSTNFHLFGRSADDSLHIDTFPIEDATASTIEGVRRYQFHSPEFTNEVHFSSWNYWRACKLGWVALLACLIVGVGGRLLDSASIRRTSPFWLSLLAVWQLIATDEFSIIGGAMLAGTIISVLLPVELLRIPDRRAFRQRRTSLAHACLLTGFCIGQVAFAQSTLAVKDAPLDLGQLTYLLKSARYQLLTTSPTKSFRAKIEVLTPIDQSETLVELPFEGVVFQLGAECTVDGEPQTFIPSLRGEGVVIRIRNQEELPRLGPDDSWQRHSIEFDFALRDNPEGDSDLPRQAKLPVISDSSLEVPSRLRSDFAQYQKRLMRLGDQSVADSQNTEVILGPVEKFFKDSISFPTNDQVQTDYTLLNVSNARIAGNYYVSDSTTVGSRENLVLEVPPKVLVTNVAGQNVAQWFLSTDDQSQQHLIVEFKPNTTERFTVVSFTLPTSINTNGEIVIHPMTWNSSRAEQVVGLRVPNGLAIQDITSQQDLQRIPLESWPQNEALGRIRPQQVLRMKLDQDLRISLSTVSASASHTIAETVTVDRTQLTYLADLEIEILDLPLFVHEFTLQGGLRIQSIRMTGSGENSLVRFYQEGTTVRVFIPGGQLGIRKLQLQGEVPFTAESFRALPGIQVSNSSLKYESLTILDETNWDIDLAMSGGTLLMRPSVKSEDEKLPRSIGSFVGPAQTRPSQIRLQPPPSATRVDTATRIQIDENQAWNVAQLLRFSGAETPLKRVVFTVPKSLENVRIGPRYFRPDQTDRGDVMEYSIPVPERFADGITIQVYYKVPEELIQPIRTAPTDDVRLELPTIGVLSARTASRLLFFNENRIVTTPAAETLSIDKKNLPEWIPLQWKEAVANSRLLSYQVLEGAPTLVARGQNNVENFASLQFVETVVWPKLTEEVDGVSRLWLTGGKQISYLLPFNSNIQIKHVYLPSRQEVEVSTNQDGSSVSLESSEAVIPITVHWKASASAATTIPPVLDESVMNVRHIFGVMETQEFSIRSNDAQVMPIVDAWIYRWNSLLQIAESVSTPVSVEGALQQDLRDCQKVLAELKEQSNLPQTTLAAIEDLESRWSNIRENLTIAVDPVLAATPDFRSSFGLQFSPQNRLQSIQWMTQTGQANPNVILQPKHRWPWWMSQLLMVALAGGVLAVIMRFKSQLKQLASTIESEPVLRLLVLGGIWFFLLTPSFFGFVLIVLGFVLQLSGSGRSHPQVAD